MTSHIAGLSARTGRSVASVSAEKQSGVSQYEAIQSLPQADQQAMIRGMVDGLAERLKESPHDAEGWLRLIRSRMVLNEPDLARDALRTAMAEFSEDPASKERLTGLAQSLGIATD